MAKNNKNKNKDKNKNKNKPKVNPVYNPLTQLKGKTLQRFVRAITNLEYNPQIKAVNQQLGSLDTQKANTVNSLTALGNQATGNIQSYYRSLAEAEAANAARQQGLAQKSQQQTASMTEQAANAVAQAGQNANAQLRQDSGARDELQAMIAEQQSRQAREAQAIQGNNTSQNENWMALQNAMAASNQSRGAQNLTNTQRQNLSDITKATTAFNEEIAAAMARRAGLKGEAAAAFIKNLYDARGSEREFNLGLQAIQGKKAYNDLIRWQTKMNIRNDREQRANSLLLQQNWINAKKQSQAFQLKLQKLYDDPSTERWREAFRKIQSEVKSGVLTRKQVRKRRQAIIANLVARYNHTEAEAIKAVNHYLKKRRK